MSNEYNQEHHYREIPDKFVNPIVDFQMRSWDYIVRPAADGDSGAITITLPPVADARGRFYSIVCRNADAVNTITIQDKDDSECWNGDITMDGKCDKLLMYSDGLCWHVCNPQLSGWPGISTTPAPGTTEPPTTVAPTTAAQ